MTIRSFGSRFKGYSLCVRSVSLWRGLLNSFNICFFDKVSVKWNRFWPSDYEIIDLSNDNIFDKVIFKVHEEVSVPVFVDAIYDGNYEPLILEIFKLMKLFLKFP